MAHMPTRRDGLLTSTALVPVIRALAAVSLIALPGAAFAQSDQRGGDGGGGINPGRGGASATESGQTGGRGGNGGDLFSAGGGGGAGSIGGNGGAGDGGNAGSGAGGAGANPLLNIVAQRGGNATANIGAAGGGGGGANDERSFLGDDVFSFAPNTFLDGADGGDALDIGGGGGGGAGGSTRLLASARLFLLGSTSGGAGGNGGQGTIGGAGGDGGLGLIVIYPPSTPIQPGGGVSLVGSVQGGAGGAGGRGTGASQIRGNGGDGGAGMQQNGNSLLNQAAILGGRGGDGNIGGGGGAGLIANAMNVFSLSAITGGAGGVSLGAGSPSGAGGIGLVGTNIELANTGTISGGLSGSGERALAMRLSGSNTITTIGTLIGGVEIASGTTTFRLFGDETIGSVISGAGAIAIDHSRTLTLSGANTFTGETRIDRGTLLASNNAALGSAAGPTIVAAGATLAIDQGVTTFSEPLTLNGAGIGGTGALRQIGGTLDLNSAITLVGASRLDFGGTATLNGTITGSHDLTIGGTGSVTVRGAINTGTGGLIKDGPGMVTLEGANGFLGATAVNGGVLALNNGQALADTALLTINNPGRVQVNASSAAGNLAGSGTLDLRGVTFTVGGQNADSTFSGFITGTSGTLLKQGTGTLTLAGTSNFTGTTRIEEGTILATSASALGPGRVELARSFEAKLSTAFNGALTNPLNVAGSAVATLAAANGTTLTLTGPINVGLGAVLFIGSKTETGTVVLGSTDVTVGQAVQFLIRGGTFRPGNQAVANLLRDLIGNSIFAFEVGGTITLDLGGSDFSLRGSNVPTNITNAIGSAGLILDQVPNSPLVFTPNIGTSILVGGSIGVDPVPAGPDDEDTPPPSPSSGWTMNGGGTLVFTNNFDTSNFSGGITVTQGTLSLQRNIGPNFGGIRTTGTVIDLGDGVNVATELEINSDTTRLQVLTGTATQSGVILEQNGPRGFEKIGAGTLVLAAQNTYTGLATVSEGTLLVTAANGLGTSAGGTLVRSGASLAFANTERYEIADVITINGTGVSGEGALQGRGFDVVIANPLVLGSNSTVGLHSGSMTLNGVSGMDLDLTVDTLANTVLRIDGDMRIGSGALTKNGDGRLDLLQPNQWTGDLILNAGFMQIGTATAPVNGIIGDSARVVLNGGAIDLGQSETIGALTGNAGSVFGDGNGNHTLTLGGDNGSTTFGGAFGDTLNVVKVGTGTLTLTGSSSNSGITRVAAGTLALGASDAMSDGSAIEIAGGTLAIGGFTDTAGSVNLSAGSITAGMGGALRSAGDYTQSGGTLAAGTAVDAGGNLRLSGGTIAGRLNGESTAATGAFVEGGTVNVTGTLATAGALRVGNAGTGTLNVSGGGLVTTGGAGFLGFEAGSQGTVNVSGTSSTWNVDGLTIGRRGGGDLVIANGGTVNNGFAGVGGFATSTATVTVTGSGSAFINTSELTIGNSGRGTLAITNGGMVENTNGSIALFGSSFGTAQVTGAGSQWTNSGFLQVGRLGTGTLEVLEGGTVTSATGTIGSAVTANGNATISGAQSSWSMTGALAVGNSGIGTLTVADEGRVGAGSITLANASGSTGTLIVGAAAAQPAARAGTIAAPTIAFGAGTGSIVFNHTSADFDLAAGLSGSGTLRQLAGTTTLSGSSEGFAGQTAVTGGRLLVTGTLGGGVTVDGGTLGGTGTITGPAAINSGGTLSAGLSAGTLTLGSLTLNAGSTTVFELDAVGSAANDLIRVTGDLALLGGTINVVPGAGFGSGQYTLIEFGSSSGLVGNLALGPLGGGLIGSLALGDDALLLNTASAGDLVWWNGSATSVGAVAGGTGTWSLGGGNFTDANGLVSGPWAGNGALAVFGGTAAGTVTIAAGEVLSPGGLNFVTDGYLITGGDAAGGLDFAGPTGIDTAAGVGATIAAVIGGSGAITKQGAGTLTLAGANTNTGPIHVMAGTLALGANNTISNAARVSIAGGTLALGTFTDTATRVDLSSGSITGGPGSALEVTGAYVQSGGTLAAGATVNVGPAGTLLLSGGTIAGTLNAGGSSGGPASAGNTGIVEGGSVTVSGRLALAGNLAVGERGSGDLTITDGGHVSATEIVIAALSGSTGVLQFGAAAGAPSAAAAATLDTARITFGAGTGTITFNHGSDDLVLAAEIAGVGTVRQLAGTTTLSGANTYLGATSVLGGTLRVTGSLASDVTVSGGSLVNAGTIEGLVSNLAALSSTGTLAGGLLNAPGATASISGVLSGAVGNGGLITLTGATGGEAVLDQAAGGVLDLAGNTLTLGSLAGAGTVQLGAGTLTVGSNGASTQFAGGIAGSGGLTKVGSGTLTLGGANSFAGPTSVAAGTLRLDAGGTLAGGVVNDAVFLNDGGTVSGLFVNNGALTSDGRLGGGLVNNAGAAASLDGAVGGDIANAGAITIAQGASGIGAVTQSASGVFDITGTSGATIGSLAGSGSVLLGAATLTTGGNDASTGFAGVIAGSGGLVKQGSGTFTLSGTNTFTGLTTIAAGTLAVAPGGALAGAVSNAGTFINGGTISGPVTSSGTLASTGTLGGGLDNLAGAAADVQGTLSGAVRNAGTLTLTGAVAGIGALEQSAGGVFDLAGNSASIGSLAGSGAVVLGGATLTTGGDDASTRFAGVIAGSGGLAKAGSGTFVLTGNSTYTGTTTIAGGRLVLGDGGTSGAIGSGAIVNNAALVIDRSDAVTLANAISGTGVLVQDGTGTTRLAGTTSHTGGTLVNRGRLAGDTAALQGAIVNNAVLEFAMPASGIFAGALSGAGRVEKTGAGILTFAADGVAFTGPFAVLGGGLRLDAANGGRLDRSVVTLAAGTTLSGTGQVGGLVVESGAVVSPGNSLGVIGVAGDIAFSPGSRVVAEVSAAGADLITAGGTVRLAGTLELVNIGAATHRFNTAFAIVEAAGGVEGSFDTIAVSGFGPIYRPVLRGTGGGLELVLAPGSFAGVAGAGLTGNQAAVAARIDAAVAAGFDPQALFGVYTLAPAALAGALDQLSGEIHPAMGRAAMRQSRLPREAVLERASSARPAGSPQGNTMGGWGKLMRSWGDVEAAGGAASQEVDTEGFVIGFDGGPADDSRSLRFGLYGSYLDTRVRIDARGSDGRIEQTGGGIYAGLALGGLSLVAGGGAAHFDITADRVVALPELGDATSAASTGDMAQLFGRIGYSFDLGAVAIETFVAGDAAWIALDPVRERGGVAAVAAGGQDYTVGGATTGIAARAALGKLRLETEAAARFELGDRVPEALVGLAAAPGQTTRIAATRLAGTAFAGRLRAVLPLTRRIEARIDYAGEFSRTDTEHTAQAGITIAF